MNKNILTLSLLLLFMVATCQGKNAIYFCENHLANVFRHLFHSYSNNLQIYSTYSDFKESSTSDIQYFFHSDNKIIPTIKAPGRVNVYFYKNNNNMVSNYFESMDNLSSFDLIYTETLEDLKQFLSQANPTLVRLAKESKYVPLIRVLFNLDRISDLVNRIRLEIPFKEYIQEALPIFKTKSLNIEPRINSNNVAVIVESAIHPALETVVRNVMYYLTSGWSLIIIHSEENGYFIKNALKDLPNIEYRLPYFPIYSVSEYNKFMKMFEFYDSLKAKKVLIFQTDSIMLKRGIDPFMKYDWVGASWPHHRAVGNGGFSLRSVEVMKEACRNACNSDNANEAEDLTFSHYIRNHHKMAPYDEAYAFSRENPVWELNYKMSAEGGFLDGHLAVHQLWLLNQEFTTRRILKHSIDKLKEE